MKEWVKQLIIEKLSNDYGYDYANDDYMHNDYAGNDYAHSQYPNGPHHMVHNNGTDRVDMAQGDGRRGVKGTGRYGIGGRDHSRGQLKLDKRSIVKWKRNLINDDGSYGEHFTLPQIMPVAQKFGLSFNGYDEEELCMTVNMIYSDACTLFCEFIPRERLLEFCVRYAAKWLEDLDGPIGSAKLAGYYCLVADD